jgi:uncharacterized protein (TIGR02996 family)
MSDLDSLLQAVQDRPDDDAVRLVLADWLEENGDQPSRARAEFIRTQIELARLPLFDGRAAVLHNRAQELLLEHQGIWLGPSQRFLLHWTFRKGFVERIRISPGDFCRHGQDLLNQHPITEVELAEVTGEDLAEVLACPQLARVRVLDFTNNNGVPAMTDDGAARLLATSPHLAQLHTLDLSREDNGGRGDGVEITPAGVEMLAGSPFLAGLDRFGVRDSLIGRDGLAALLGQPTFSLTTLDLSSCALDAGAVRDLAQSTKAVALSKLGLSWNDIGDEGIRALVSSLWLRQLTELGLRSTDLGETAGELLGAWSGLARITRLDLSQNHLGDRGVAALLRSPFLESLVELKLWSTRSGKASAAALASSPHLSNLRRLELEDIGREGAEALIHAASLTGLTALSLDGLTNDEAEVLSRARNLRGLTNLDLHGCSCTEGWLGMLASSEAFAGVTTLRLSWLRGRTEPVRGAIDQRARWRPRHLWLTGTQLRPDDAAALARAGCLAQLRSLYLDDNHQIGDEGVARLAASGVLEHLQVLSLRSNGITDAGASLLGLLAGSDRLKRLRVLDLRYNRIGQEGLLAVANSPLLRQLTHLKLYQQGDVPLQVQQALARSPHTGNLLHLDVGPEPASELAARLGLALSEHREDE